MFLFVVVFLFRRLFSFILGILTRQDFDLYYHGERCASDLAHSFTCPFCGEMGFAYPFLNESSLTSQNLDFFHHLQCKHADEQQPTTVINEFTQKTEIVKLTVVN